MPGKRYSREEVDFIKENYTKIGAIATAKALKKSITGIHKKANSLGLHVPIDIHRKNSIKKRAISTLNTNYFDTLDTYNQGYILGFIYADGSMSSTEPRTVIEVHIQDIEVLEFIKKELNIKANIYKRKNRPNASIWLSTNIMHDTLKNLGVHPNKAYTITFPDFGNTEFIRGFISGYFDGDGSHSIKHSTYMVSNFRSCSLNFLKNLSKYICSCIDISTRKVYLEEKAPVGTLNFCGANAIKFCDWMYKPEEFHISRKYLKYSEVKECLLK